MGSAVLDVRARRWCADVLADDVVAADPLGGGTTDAIWRIATAGRGSFVLRWLHPDHRVGAEGHDWIAREALGCRLTGETAVPAPTLVATDADGALTGGWANLTTLLPGQVRLDALGPSAMAALARVAVDLHAVEVPPQAQPPGFVSWAPPEPEVPTWARRPDVWHEAIERYAAPAPPTRRHLIHRDFHPGNTLWEGDVVTGLIDWAETAWGPSDLDVAHACSNFAMLHTVEDARAFREAYANQGGLLDPDPEARRYWAAFDVLGFLPDPGPIVVALTRRRPDLEPDGVRHRLEELLALELRSP